LVLAQAITVTEYTIYDLHSSMAKSFVSKRVINKSDIIWYYSSPLY